MKELTGQFQPLQVSTKYPGGLPGQLFATGFLRQTKAHIILFRGGGDPSSTLTWRPQVLVTRSEVMGGAVRLPLGVHLTGSVWISLITVPQTEA